MFRGSNMGIGAGPLYTNAIMGHVLSPAERESARKASSTILREDRIQIEESDHVSRPDSFSIHCNYTDQAPYSGGDDGTMLTQKSVLHLPPENPSHDLALFLRLTGPTQPQRRPSKLENSERSLSGRGKSLRFLKRKRKRPLPLSACPPETANVAPSDPARSLTGSQSGVVEQKATKDGTKYLALNVKEDSQVLDSRISVLVVPPQVADPVSEGGKAVHPPRLQPRPPTLGTMLSGRTTPRNEAGPRTKEAVSHGINHTAASNAPTPEPGSAISVTYSLWSETEKSIIRLGAEREWRWPDRSIEVNKMASASLPNMLHVVDPRSEDSRLSLARCGEMRHPTPQRFASYPTLSQAAPFVVSDASPGSVGGSPRPPERSPLRLRRDEAGVETGQPTQSERKPTIKAVPSTMSFHGHNQTNHNEGAQIKPTVVTDCTGPIKRPSDRASSQRNPNTPSRSRQEREDRIRERKLRDRANLTGKSDPVASKSPPTTRQRLRKARPQIQIPNLQVQAQATRASSSESSNASWKKVIESTRTPASAMPSEDTRSTPDDAGRLDISPATTSTIRTERMTMTPVMLVAEEMPVSKPIPAAKPSKVMLKEGKSYAPRPRSASVPTIVQRRSQPGSRTTSRPTTPPEGRRGKHAAPFPSTPPKCALPPLPKSMERTKGKRATQSTMLYPRKPVPVRTYATYVANPGGDEKRPTVRSKYQDWPNSAAPSSERPDIYARVEALEKKNALLLDKLNKMAMAQSKGLAEKPRIPMVWENRIARRSAASRFAPNSGRSQEVMTSDRYDIR